MRLWIVGSSVAGGLALAATFVAPSVLADHLPVPPPPELALVSIEPEYGEYNGQTQVFYGYWYTFDVTSYGGPEWLAAHGGNGFKLWRREDSQGDTSFEYASSTYSVGDSTYRFRVKLYEYEWTSTFHATEFGGFIGGNQSSQETGPSNEVTVTSPMPPPLIDLYHPVFPAAGFVTSQGATRPISSLPTLLEEETGPTIGMLIYGYNLAYPDLWPNDDDTPPAGYPSPRIRWNGELGLVSGEHQRLYQNAVEFDVPRELLYAQNGETTATIDFVQGTAQVASPEPYVLTLAPPPPGPKNVIAVADARKPRRKAWVRVTWEPPASGGAPTEYVIQRRVRPDPAAKEKADTDFVDIGTIPGSASRLEFTDRKATPDEVHEYRVGSRTASVDFSRPDDAHTPPAKGIKYVLPDYELWKGPFWWALKRDASGLLVRDRDVTLFRSDDVTPKVAKFLLDAPGVRLSGTVPKALLRRSRFVLPLRIETIDLAEPKLPNWVRGLAIGAKLNLDLQMQDAPPGSPDTFLLINGGIRFGKRNPEPLTFTLEDPVVEYLGQYAVDVAATVGVGAKSTSPGEAVVVVFQCVNLGDDGGTKHIGPLLWGQAFLDVEITNGSILQVFDEGSTDHFEPLGEVAGFTTARFRVGALGRDAKGKSQVATLALLVEVDRPTTAPRKLRCKFELAYDDQSRGDAFGGLWRARIVAKGDERVVDVEILDPPDTK